MTNGQQLPIDVASKNLDTFNIDLEQVTPNPISIASAEIISDTVYDNVGGCSRIQLINNGVCNP
jgi:hypothetical protein